MTETKNKDDVKAPSKRATSIFKSCKKDEVTKSDMVNKTEEKHSNLSISIKCYEHHDDSSVSRKNKILLIVCLALAVCALCSIIITILIACKVIKCDCECQCKVPLCMVILWTLFLIFVFLLILVLCNYRQANNCCNCHLIDKLNNLNLFEKNTKEIKISGYDSSDITEMINSIVRSENSFFKKGRKKWQQLCTRFLVGGYFFQTI